MRNKGLIAVIVFGFLLVLVSLIFSLTRGPSLQVPELTPTGKRPTTEIIVSNTPTEEAENKDQDNIPSNTMTPVQTPSSTPPATQTEPVTNETLVVATATIPPPSPEAGTVTIVTDKREYAVGEVIVVTVNNNLNTTITTVDQKAFCTVILMESLEGSDWQEVRNCSSTMPVAEITIDPGGTRVEQLQAFAAGTYRVGLIYSIGDAYDGGNLLAIFTPPFDVKG